jgi:hypothetical protein
MESATKRVRRASVPLLWAPSPPDAFFIFGVEAEVALEGNTPLELPFSGVCDPDRGRFSASTLRTQLDSPK